MTLRILEVNAGRVRKTVDVEGILGLIAGVVFGALDVALMLPMSFPDKTAALLGAFTSRFASASSLVACSCPPGPVG